MFDILVVDFFVCWLFCLCILLWLIMYPFVVLFMPFLAVDYVFVGCSVVYGCFIENEAILPASAAAVRVPELIA